MKSAEQDMRAAVIDGLLKLTVTGGLLSVGLLAPNMVQVLERPLGRFFKAMDKRAQQRELRRALYYMKRQKLISLSESGYDHGIRLTKRGQARLQKVELEALRIPTPVQWDKKWRLVFFDVPETQKAGRDALTRKLQALGFYPLQRSVLVHPYPCREEVATVTGIYKINRYVSYIETDHIDRQNILIKQFRRAHKL